MTVLDLAVICTIKRHERTAKEIVTKLIDEIEEETINYPNIYRVLQKMKKAGYINSNWEERNKKYRITAKGQNLVNKVLKLGEIQ